MKSKIIAGILGILIGGWGAHKFYMGKIGMGILYICLCWTGIPSLVGLIEGIIYLVESDEAFQARLNK
jgi:TM2 domain-containing membrane protein YozV